MNMSLPKECQTALDRVNEIGGHIKSAKEANTDFAPLLEELTIAKAALNKVIRPIAEAEKEKGSTDYYWNVLAPVFEKVMTKGEKKKHDKENKNRKKALAAGGSGNNTASSTSTDDGEKKISKKEVKRLEKAAKKRAAIAAKKATNKTEAAAATTTTSTSSSSTTTNPSSTSRDTAFGNGRESKSRRLNNEGSAFTTLTPPLLKAPRAPIAGQIDPARCPFPSSIKFLLLVAKMAGHTNVQLGRFQQNALFMNVPSYDVGNGSILSGTNTIAEYLINTATTPIEGSEEVAEWQSWCADILSPNVLPLIQSAAKSDDIVGVVFQSVVKKKNSLKKRKECKQNIITIMNECMQQLPTSTIASIMVASQLDDIRIALANESDHGNDNLSIMNHDLFQWVDSVLKKHVDDDINQSIQTFYLLEKERVSSISRHGLDTLGITSILSSFVCDTIQRAYPTITIPLELANVTPSGGRSKADFQCGVANIIVAKLKKMSAENAATINSASVATTLSGAMKDYPSVLSSVETSSGFLNFYMNHTALAEVATSSIFNAPSLLLPESKRKRVAVDFSSPNIAKEM
jgi:hypothetical protein